MFKRGVEPSIIVQKVLDSKDDYGYGGNDEYVDMFKTGIIDPTKVSRDVEMINIGLLLTTGKSIQIGREKTEPTPPMNRGMMINNMIF